MMMMTMMMMKCDIFMSDIFYECLRIGYTAWLPYTCFAFAFTCLCVTPGGAM